MPNTIEPEQVAEIQHRLGLKDTEIARALGITCQTWRNWWLSAKRPVKNDTRGLSPEYCFYE